MTIIIVVDLFCGAGGVTEGFEKAKHKDVVYWVLAGVNHDPKAVESHKENHPETHHFIEDVRDMSVVSKIGVLVRDAKKYMERQGHTVFVLLHASLECFPEETLVLAKRGLVSIKEIAVGEEVLTHNGRWRRVTSVMSKVANTVSIKGQGHGCLEVTEEHPFYTRSQHKVWDNPKRRWNYKQINPPEWVAAKELKNGKHRWATPIRYDSIEIPVVGGRGMDFSDLNFWWMVGRWLGDGLVSNSRKGEITIVCGFHKVDKLSKKLESFNPTGLRAKDSQLKWSKREVRTAAIFTCSHLGLSEWLVKEFGRLAHGKTMPAWALSMPVSYRESLLEGYLSADGHIGKSRTQVSTVSKKLAIGIRLLAESLGYRVFLNLYKQHCKVIEGREVNVKDIWHLAWDNNKSNRSAFEDDCHAWSLVKDIKEARKNVTVYNLSVEEDESYIADGIVVHNCTNFSNAKGGQSRDADSRSLADSMPAYLKELDPDYFTVENVREFMSWGPLRIRAAKKHKTYTDLAIKFNKKLGRDDYMWMPKEKQKGVDYMAWRNGIEAMGYTYDHRLLNAADYGAYTSRTRYFAMFSKIGLPVAWPEPTHSKKPSNSGWDLFSKKMQKWKPVREVLNLHKKGRSIFNRSKPLSEKTLERIYAGLVKHVAGGEESFIQKHYSGAPSQKCVSIHEPAGTMTTTDSHSLVSVQPFIMSNYSGSVSHRCKSLEEPCATITTAGTRHQVVTPEPFLMTYNSGSDKNRVRSLSEPCPTVTTKNAHAVVTPEFLIKYHGSETGGHSINNPAGTITTKDEMALISSQFLDLQFSQGKKNQSLDAPSASVTTVPKLNLVTANYLVTTNHGGWTHGVESPSPTIIARQDKSPISLVTAEYGHPNWEILDTDSSVTVKIKMFMRRYHIADILMRMLYVDELLRIQGFPENYVLKGTQTDKKKFIGNSVVPLQMEVWAEALADAIFIFLSKNIKTC